MSAASSRRGSDSFGAIQRSQASRRRDAAEKASAGGNYDSAIAELTRAIYLTPDDAHLYVERGDAYLNLRDLNSAKRNYKKALQLSPHLKDAQSRWNLLTTTMAARTLNRGQTSTARAALKTADRSAENLYLRAVCEVRDGNLKEALAFTEDALGETPAMADAHMLRGALLLLQNQAGEGVNKFAQAVSALWKAFSHNPADTSVQYFLLDMHNRATQLHEQAMSLVFQHDYWKALEMLNQASDVAPDHPASLFLRATVHRRLDRFDEALTDLQHCSACCTEDIREQIMVQAALTYGDMARNLHKNGHFKEAITLCNEAGTFHHVPMTRLLRGECRLQLGLHQDAIHDFKQELEHATNAIPPEEILSPDIQRTKSTRQHGDGPAEESSSLASELWKIRRCRRICEVHGALSRAYQLLGIHHFNKGDYVGASMELTKAIDHIQPSRFPQIAGEKAAAPMEQLWLPIDAQLFLHRGYAAFYSKRMEQALRDFDTASRLDPSIPFPLCEPLRPPKHNPVIDTLPEPLKRALFRPRQIEALNLTSTLPTERLLAEESIRTRRSPRRKEDQTETCLALTDQPPSHRPSATPSVLSERVRHIELEGLRVTPTLMDTIAEVTEREGEGEGDSSVRRRRRTTQDHITVRFAKEEAERKASVYRHDSYESIVATIRSSA
ncbi:unnamed protein product [Vitrella brassicaformis CCMP3155]|uniref:MalT-like TPR region domain-containing protein n=1 Tax=Vitrella brassicaformis (strain CCMP3155) TaxID=1169540 RepID=A0A0G4H339_VITBC|nr:unnamed protein product [Vitrella brassicaformis CCMP3155]|eukprot:CEM38002.1 unnamed protein product [Vitrella brassicaformis CCMP3155]